MQPGMPSETAQYVACLRALGNLAPGVPGFGDAVSERLLPPGWSRRVAKARARLAGHPGRSPYSLLDRGMGVFCQFRTLVLDRAIAAALPFAQLVILGAGLDSRAWRLPCLSGTRVFLVDHPATQALLREAGGRLPALAQDVRYVPMDFTRDDLAARLAEAGHDAGQATFWLWEGVVMYLSPAEVARTLGALAGLSAPDSRLALTYLSRTSSRRPDSFFLALMGEPCRSAYLPAELDDAAARAGWRTLSDTGIGDWKRELTPGLDLTAGHVGLQWNERIWTGLAR